MESKIERAKRLSARANDARATDAERETAQRLLSDLLIKWNIDEAILADASHADRGEIGLIIYEPSGPACYTQELATMAHFIARSGFGVLGFVQRKGTKHHAAFVGYREDVERAKMLADSIIGQLNLMIALEIAQLKASNLWARMTSVERYNWRRTFMIGFSNTIVQRLEALKSKHVSDASAGTDLVLIDREAQVESWINNKFKLKTSTRRWIRGDGGNAGRDAGERADIGQDSLNGGWQAISS